MLEKVTIDITREVPKLELTSSMDIISLYPIIKIYLNVFNSSSKFNFNVLKNEYTIHFLLTKTKVKI